MILIIYNLFYYRTIPPLIYIGEGGMRYHDDDHDILYMYYIFVVGNLSKNL